MGVMEHYADVVERLSVLAAYLRPGGRIVTTVPNLPLMENLLRTKRHRRLRGRRRRPGQS